MSDTHAQTAKVQADVQTGRPHIPPGDVEHGRQAERPAGTRSNSLAPWLLAGVIAVLVVLAAIFYLG